MSFKEMAWAVEQELPVQQKMVLLILSSHANGHTGRCDPSIPRLAKECGMSQDSVIRALKALEEAELVKKIQRKEDGIFLRNNYELLMQGVVADSDQGGQIEGGGSRCERPGVVADSDHKQEVKTKRHSDSPSGSSDIDFNPLHFLIQRGVCKQIASEWLKCRKTKKLANTQTAFDLVEKEAKEAGLSLQEAIKYSVEKGWGSFRGKWIEKGTSPSCKQIWEN